MQLAPKPRLGGTRQSSYFPRPQRPSEEKETSKSSKSSRSSSDARSSAAAFCL